MSVSVVPGGGMVSLPLFSSLAYQFPRLVVLNCPLPRFPTVFETPHVAFLIGCLLVILLRRPPIWGIRQVDTTPL